MSSSVSSPPHRLPGNPALLPPSSSTQPPPSVRRLLLLPRHPSSPSISGHSNPAPRNLTPVVRSGWRDPSAFPYSLLAEVLEDIGADGGEGSPLSPSAAESVAAAYPALVNTHVLWFKFETCNFEVMVEEDEPEEELFRTLRKELSHSGVLRECRRRRFCEDKQAKKKRKAREAARRNRRSLFVSAGSYPPPYVMPHLEGRSQRGGAKKSRKSSKRRRRARTPLPDQKVASKKDEDEEEDNWELPEVEVPY